MLDEPTFGLPLWILADLRRASARPGGAQIGSVCEVDGRRRAQRCVVDRTADRARRFPGCSIRRSRSARRSAEPHQDNSAMLASDVAVILAQAGRRQRAIARDPSRGDASGIADANERVARLLGDPARTRTGGHRCRARHAPRQPSRQRRVAARGQDRTQRSLPTQQWTRVQALLRRLTRPNHTPDRTDFVEPTGLLAPPQIRKQKSPPRQRRPRTPLKPGVHSGMRSRRPVAAPDCASRRSQDHLTWLLL